MNRFDIADPSTATETYAIVGWLFSCTRAPEVPRTDPPEGLALVAELGHTPLGWRYDVALRRAWEGSSPALREWLTEHLFPLCDEHLRQCILGTRRSR